MPSEIATPTQLQEKNELQRVIEDLSPPQAAALQILIKGATFTAAAVAAAVDRRTIYNWLEPGQPLRVALDLWKSDLAQCARTRLVMMTDLATSNVAVALKRGDTRTALKLLEKLGILAAPPVGPTEQEARRDRLNSKSKLESEKSKAAESLSLDIGSWNNHFTAAGMEFDSSLDSESGPVDEASGDDPERGRGGGDGCGDDARLRDQRPGDADS
jgi:hypothetical protein